MNELQPIPGSPDLKTTALSLSARPGSPVIRFQSALNLLLIAILFLFLPATGCRPPDDNYAPKNTNPGVTAGEVLLGSSLALKGHASFLGTQTLRGAMNQYHRHSRWFDWP